MKLFALLLTLSLFTVACNKAEEAAAPAAGAEAASEAAAVGHDKDHNHVPDEADHMHDDAHHSEK